MENTVTISLTQWDHLNRKLNDYERITGSSDYVSVMYNTPFSSHFTLIKVEDFKESLHKANTYLKKEIVDIKSKNLLQLIKWWFKNKNN